MKEHDCVYHARGDERRSLMILPLLGGELRFVGTHELDRFDVVLVVESLRHWLDTGSLITPTLAASRE